MEVAVWAGPVFSLLGSLAGLSYFWGKVRQSLEEHDKTIREIKGSLYKSNGTTVYMSRSECMEQRNRWESFLALQINEIKNIVSDLRAEMLNNHAEHTRELKAVMKFMGRVEEHLLKEKIDA